MGKQYSYPTLQLAVSLNSYRWRRRIILARLTSEGIDADIGVLAGPVYAMYELLLSLVERCDRHAEKMALCGMRLSVHVDDFSQTLRWRSREN